MKKFTLDIYTISRCAHNYYARELRKLSITMGQFPVYHGNYRERWNFPGKTLLGNNDQQKHDRRDRSAASQRGTDHA